MANRPQHSDLINIIKCIFRVNKLKTPNFLGRFIIPNILNPLYFHMDYRLQYRSDLVILTSVDSLRSRNLQHKPSKKSTAGFPDAPWQYGQLLIQYNQATRHEYPIDGPSWDLIGQKLHEWFNTNTKFLLSSPNFSSQPCKSSESLSPGPELPWSYCAPESTVSCNATHHM